MLALIIDQVLLKGVCEEVQFTLALNMLKRTNLNDFRSIGIGISNQAIFNTGILTRIIQHWWSSWI